MKSRFRRIPTDRAPDDAKVIGMTSRLFSTLAEEQQSGSMNQAPRLPLTRGKEAAVLGSQAAWSSGVGAHLP